MTDLLIGQVDLINAIEPWEEYTVWEQILGTMGNKSQKGVASHHFERVIINIIFHRFGPAAAFGGGIGFDL